MEIWSSDHSYSEFMLLPSRVVTVTIIPVADLQLSQRESFYMNINKRGNRNSWWIQFPFGDKQHWWVLQVSAKTPDIWISIFNFFWGFSFKSQMERLAFCCFFSTFPSKPCLFGSAEFALRKAVVWKWKSTHSPFQNTKNYWNRKSIRDEIFNLVMESIIFTWSSVN